MMNRVFVKSQIIFLQWAYYLQGGHCSFTVGNPDRCHLKQVTEVNITSNSTSKSCILGYDALGIIGTLRNKCLLVKPPSPCCFCYSSPKGWIYLLRQMTIYSMSQYLIGTINQINIILKLTHKNVLTFNLSYEKKFIYFFKLESYFYFIFTLWFGVINHFITLFCVPILISLITNSNLFTLCRSKYIINT